MNKKKTKKERYAKRNLAALHKEDKVLLIKFSVENYTCFAEKVCLDFEVAPEITTHAETLIDVEGVKLLPVVALFGANASGKTQVLNAFHTMAQTVIYSGDRDFRLQVDYEPHTPFAFDAKKESYPTKYEIELFSNSKFFYYGFYVFKDKILSESLLQADTHRELEEAVSLLENEGVASLSGENCVLYRDKENFEFNLPEEQRVLITSRSDSNVDIIFLIKALNDLGRFDSSLILSFLAGFGGLFFDEICAWFLSSVYLGREDFDGSAVYDSDHENSYKWFQILLSNKDYRLKAEKIIGEIDRCIQGLNIKETKSFFDEEKSGIDIRLSHRYRNHPKKKKAFLPAMSESNGTKKILAYLPNMLETLELGGLLLIDELDAKLHPLVFEYVVKLFTDPAINVGRAQLIFTSHAPSILDDSNLRIDEVYFTEKNAEGVSRLYSLVDFKWQDERLESGNRWGADYLFGRYGGIPNLNKED